MERVKEEMRQFRENKKEAAKLGLDRPGRPELAAVDGYLIYPYNEDGGPTIGKPRIVLLDVRRISSSLTDVERGSLEKLLAKLGLPSSGLADKESSAPETAPQPPAPVPLSSEDEEEFQRLWARLSQPDIGEAEETDLLKSLIQQQRVDLLKVLLARVAETKGLGRSKLFAVLCQRYVGERVYKEEKPPAEPEAPVEGKEAAGPPETASLSSEDEGELNRLYTALSRPEITEAEETDLLKALIQQKRVDLVKVLVGRVAEVRGMGRSKLFAVLCQRYVGERRYKVEQPATVPEAPAVPVSHLPPEAASLSSEDEAELNRLYTVLSRPEISDAEETELFRTVIQAQPVDFVKILVGRVAKTRSMGRSKLFAVLCQRYVGERVYSGEPAAAAATNETGTPLVSSGPPSRRGSQDSSGSKSRHSSGSKSRHSSGSKSRHSSGSKSQHRERSRSRHNSGSKKSSKERTRDESAAKEHRSRHSSEDKDMSRHPTGEKQGFPEKNHEANGLPCSSDEPIRASQSAKVKPRESDLGDHVTADRKSSESDKENQVTGVAKASGEISVAAKRPGSPDGKASSEKRPKLSPKESKRRKRPDLAQTTVVLRSDMPVNELRQQLGLIRLNVFVRVKNCRLIHRALMGRLQGAAATGADQRGLNCSKSPLHVTDREPPLSKATDSCDAEVIVNPLFSMENGGSGVGAEFKPDLPAGSVKGSSGSRSGSGSRSMSRISRSRSPLSSEKSKRSLSRSASRSRSRSTLRTRSRSRSRSASR
jgi:hypothetical protein